VGDALHGAQCTQKPGNMQIPLVVAINICTRELDRTGYVSLSSLPSSKHAVRECIRWKAQPCLLRTFRMWY
jgi:hypothetical protein